MRRLPEFWNDIVQVLIGKLILMDKMVAVSVPGLSSWNYSESKISSIFEEEEYLSDSVHAGGRWAAHRCVEDRDALGLAMLASEEGFDVNCRDGAGISPLMCAARLGFEDMLERLSSIGGRALNIDLQDNEGRTALMWAVSLRRENSVSRLLEMGASLDIGDKFEETPLLVAVRMGQVEMVKLICEYAGQQADPSRYLDAKSCNGLTPAMFAMELKDERSRLAILEILMLHGADMSLPNPSSGSMIQQALNLGDPALVKLFLGSGRDEKINLDAEEIKRVGGLPYNDVVKAVVEEKWAALQALVDSKVRMSEPFSHGVYRKAGFTDEDFRKAWGQIMNNEFRIDQSGPIMLAVDNNFMQAVSILCEMGWDPDGFTNEVNQTALTRAAQLQSYQIVDILGKHGAHPRAVDIYGYDSVSWAAVHSDRDLIRLLLGFYKDNESKASGVWESLKTSLLEGKKEFAEHLLDEYVRPLRVEGVKMPGFDFADFAGYTVESLVKSFEEIDWVQDLFREFKEQESIH